MIEIVDHRLSVDALTERIRAAVIVLNHDSLYTTERRELAIKILEGRKEDK